VLLFDISDNKLTNLTEFAFRDYRFLEYLNLCENEIVLVNSGAFHGLASLKKIDLSCNNLNYIAPSIFSDNPVLETVSFRGNPLAYFPDSSPILASLSIISLDLSSCTLTSVNSDTFSQLPNLRILNLNSNRLREFSLDILNTLTGVSNVDLGNNMWKCDCKIVEVLILLSKRRNSTSVDGEHKPVKCLEAGVYKTIWMTMSKNESCTEQSRKSSEKVTSAGPTNILGSTENLSTNLQMKEREEDISALESVKKEVLITNKQQLVILVILCVFGLLLAIIAVKIFNLQKNFRFSVSAQSSKQDLVDNHTYEEIPESVIHFPKHTSGKYE
jgi:Leucine-rich repeat (LRR) protein